MIVLLVLAGIGAWNYQRNRGIEDAAAASRPYQSYASSDLESLQNAYAIQLESERANFAHSKSRRAKISQNRASIADNVEQFDRTKITSSAIREAASHVADRRSQIAELNAELELRARFGQGMARHLNLLLDIDDLFSS